MVRIKICGITNREDALLASSLGSDALGFIFAESERRVTPEDAREIIEELPPFIVKVGVFVNEEIERVEEIAEFLRLDVLQFHGDEPPSYTQKFKRRVIKSFRVRDGDSLKAISDYKVSAYLLDTYSPGVYGGTGETFNWDLAIRAKEFGTIILAGGLNPDNVALAIQKVMPYAVDVSSGVESSPGKKDPARLAAFIQKVRKVEYQK
ncbi:MAG TPA: phosphoribosylanthranilate isomerase [Candidatus Omnitrophica bacterium]|nr:phosphoribosylanthranilate isomerase [Candidatus Omnitrophota bacterium]